MEITEKKNALRGHVATAACPDCCWTICDRSGCNVVVITKTIITAVDCLVYSPSVLNECVN
jgi:hypothetical protein